MLGSYTMLTCLRSRTGYSDHVHCSVGSLNGQQQVCSNCTVSRKASNSSYLWTLEKGRKRVWLGLCMAGGQDGMWQKWYCMCVVGMQRGGCGDIESGCANL